MVSIAINHQTRFGTILVACHSPLSANILSSSSLLSFADLLRVVQSYLYFKRSIL